MRLGRFVRSQEEAQVDLTPMLDVVFILLIFFIVSSQFVQPKKVDLQRASTQSEQALPEAMFNLAISADNQYYVDGEPITESALKMRLMVYQQTSPQGSFMIDADESVPTGEIVKLIDLANKSGILQVGLVAERR